MIFRLFIYLFFFFTTNAHLKLFYINNEINRAWWKKIWREFSYEFNYIGWSMKSRFIELRWKRSNYSQLRVIILFWYGQKNIYSFNSFFVTFIFREYNYDFIVSVLFRFHKRSFILRMFIYDPRKDNLCLISILIYFIVLFD